MSNHRPRVLLIVVRRKPVIFFTDETLEVLPSSPCYQADIALIIGSQRLGRRFQIAAHPKRDQRRCRPQHEERCRKYKSTGSDERPRNTDQEDEHFGGKHETKEGFQIVCASLLCLSGRLPLKQSLLCDQLAIKRKHDGV